MTEIRVERPEDRAAALEVERAAFGETGEEDVRIVEAVRDEEASFALVAVDRDVVVGHVQFSRGWIGETPVLALGPIGVLPDRQRRGIGSEMIRAGFEEARTRGEKLVMLLGDPAYYGRFGFVAGARFGLRNPYAGVNADGFVIDEEDFMVAILGSGDVPSGEVRWHPAFG